MNTHSEQVARLQAAGYTEDLTIDEDGKISNIEHNFDANEITVDETHRFEGMSNPGDESILLAVSGPDGIKGTLSLPYGPDVSGPQADAIRQLVINRS